MSRRLQMQMAALKIVDTLIDAGFVLRHEEPPIASAMQVPAFGPATGRYPRKFLGMATVSAEVHPELMFAAGRGDSALQDMLDAAMNSEIGDAPPEVKLGHATQCRSCADATKPNPPPTPNCNLHSVQATVPFEDTELSSLYSPPTDPTAGWDAIEGDEPEPPAEIVDSPFITEEDEPAPVCNVTPELPLLIDAKALAALIGRSPGQLTTDALKSVIPPPVRVGRARMWRRAEIETWVAAGCPTWAPEPVKAATLVAPPPNPIHLKAYMESEKKRKEAAEKRKLKLVSDEEVIERTGDERLEAEEDGVDDPILEDDDEDDDDGELDPLDDYVPPPLTPEIMAKVFANMREHGQL
jgi:predicted DNA-binding transcriptional regulator AlpA